MTIKIVTDSSSDIPPEVARELGITVVPLTVAFGDEAYLDGVEITADTFYTRLENTSVWPTTSSPSIGQFAETFNSLADETDEIVAILLSSKFSPCYEYGLKAKDLVKKPCRIEVIDSQLGAAPLGLVVIAAAREIIAGASIDETIAKVNDTIPRAKVLIFFDTLKYLEKGGRIGKARALMGSILGAKPLVTIKDGESFPAGRVRSRREGLDRLFKFAISFSDVSDMIVEHTNSLDEANSMAERIQTVLPSTRIYLSRICPVIGTHLGPGAIGVSVLEG